MVPGAGNGGIFVLCVPVERTCGVSTISDSALDSSVLVPRLALVNFVHI